jgi:MATE family multidrug resistance protein
MPDKSEVISIDLKPALEKQVNTFARTWQVSYPIIVNNFAQILLGIIDTIMLSRLSTNALAGVALAVSVYTVSSMLMSGWATATQTLIARRIGAKRLEQIGPIVDISLLFTIGSASIISIVILFFCPYIMRLFSTDVTLTAAGTLYLQIRILGLILVATTGTLRAFYSGLGATRISMYTAFMVNIVHIPINYLFIFIFHWGVAGAACGSLISTTTGTCCMLWFGLNHYRKTYPFFQRHHFKISTFRELAPAMWKISWPETTALFLVYFADLLIVGFVAAFGTTEIAGIRILVNIESLMFTLVFACSIGGSILIGQALGAGNLENARIYLRNAVILTSLLAGGIGLLIILLPHVILNIFTPDPAVVGAATPALYLLVCNLPLMVFTMTFSGALRAAGNTRSVMNITLIASYIFYLPLAWIFLEKLHMGLLGPYVALFIYWIIRLSATMYRFSKGDWKTSKI